MDHVPGASPPRRPRPDPQPSPDSPASPAPSPTTSPTTPPPSTAWTPPPSNISTRPRRRRHRRPARTASATSHRIDRPDLTTAAERPPAGTDPPSDASVICHGDLHPFNILTHPDGDTVLDWSATRIAHPAYDIAFTHLLLATLPCTPPPCATRTRPRRRALARPLPSHLPAPSAAHRSIPTSSTGTASSTPCESSPKSAPGTPTTNSTTTPATPSCSSLPSPPLTSSPAITTTSTAVHGYAVTNAVRYPAASTPVMMIGTNRGSWRTRAPVVRKYPSFTRSPANISPAKRSHQSGGPGGITHRKHHRPMAHHHGDDEHHRQDLTVNEPIDDRAEVADCDHGQNDERKPVRGRGRPPTTVGYGNEGDPDRDQLDRCLGPPPPSPVGEMPTLRAAGPGSGPLNYRSFSHGARAAV